MTIEEAKAEITRLRAMLRIVREHLAKHSNDERSALVVAIDETLRGGK